MASLEELMVERTKKIQALRNAGIDPYPATSHRTTSTRAFSDHFVEHERSGEHHTIAGRIRNIRSFGKLKFLVCQDESGSLQFVVKNDELQKADQTVNANIDIGDIIEATGTAFTTKKGERSLLASTLRILTKTVRPLPEKWHGLKDHEDRYRRRYVDLIMNTDVKELFRKRSELIWNIRTYWNERGFMEVETPILENVPGGAEAEPFITHHNTLDIDLFLRISLELHLKRLLVGGYEKIFEIGKVFRNEGMSTQHLQEFTLLELYWTYIDYNRLMDETEKFLTTVIERTFGTLETTVGETVIRWNAPWPKVRYADAFKEHTGIDLLSANDAELLRYAQKRNLEVRNTTGRGRLIDTIYKSAVRPLLIQPTFLIDHPVDISPLSKRHRDNERLVERFQVIVNGVEIDNAFSELNDPIDQRERFEAQAKLRTKGDREAYMTDDDFLESIEVGMPPTAGMGMSIERLLMLLTNCESIRDVVFFPTMKPKSDPVASQADDTPEKHGQS